MSLGESDDERPCLIRQSCVSIACGEGKKSSICLGKSKLVTDEAWALREVLKKSNLISSGRVD